MSHWTGNCGSPLYYEILKRTAENNEREFSNEITNIIDPEKLKTLYLEMLDEVGCKLMLYTFAEDAICDGDQGKSRNPHDHNRDYTENPMSYRARKIFCKSDIENNS